MRMFFTIALLASFAVANAGLPAADGLVQAKDSVKKTQMLKIKKMSNEDKIFVPTKIEEADAPKPTDAKVKEPESKKSTPAKAAKAAKANEPRVEEKTAITNSYATYPGGQKALREFVRANTRYPAECKEQRLAGKAVVEVTILADGSQTGARIHQSSGNAHMDAEALRVVSLMPKWDPAKGVINAKEHVTHITVNFRPGR